MKDPPKKRKKEAEHIAETLDRMFRASERVRRGEVSRAEFTRQYWIMLKCYNSLKRSRERADHAAEKLEEARRFLRKKEGKKNVVR